MGSVQDYFKRHLGHFGSPKKKKEPDLDMASVEASNRKPTRYSEMFVLLKNDFIFVSPFQIKNISYKIVYYKLSSLKHYGYKANGKIFWIFYP